MAKTGGTTFITVFDLHEQVLIEVTDDGIGIEEKYFLVYLSVSSVQIPAVRAK
jgi:signal transduction histidine kinase